MYLVNVFGFFATLRMTQGRGLATSYAKLSLRRNGIGMSAYTTLP